jgi:hypothetical protein
VALLDSVQPVAGEPGVEGELLLGEVAVQACCADAVTDVAAAGEDAVVGGRAGGTRPRSVAA